MSAPPLLKIEDLKTYFYTKGRRAFIRSVDGLSLEIRKGETLGVVGESGSGKSVMALSVMGLVGAAPGVIAGRIGLKTDAIQKNLLQDIDDYVECIEADGRVVEVRKDVVGWQNNLERRMAAVRGKAVAMIFQNPAYSLNPIYTIGDQLGEILMWHEKVSQRTAATAPQASAPPIIVSAREARSRVTWASRSRSRPVAFRASA